MIRDTILHGSFLACDAGNANQLLQKGNCRRFQGNDSLMQAAVAAHLSCGTASRLRNGANSLAEDVIVLLRNVRCIPESNKLMHTRVVQQRTVAVLEAGSTRERDILR